MTDYSKQAKAVDKSKLDGLKLDQDIVFDTLKKLKVKGASLKRPLQKSLKRLRGQNPLKTIPR